MSTIQEISNWFREQAEQGNPIPPYIALEKCQMLNSLAGDIDDKIVEYRSALNSIKANLITAGESVAKATVLTEATEEWKEWKKLEAQRERITESIRIAKQISRVNNDREKF